MNGDIRLSVTCPDHPKTIKLMRRLGDRSFYHLVKLWCFAAQNRPDGILSGLDKDDLEIASGWNGEDNLFIDTLLDLRFLDYNEGIYIVHDWTDHNPWVSGSTSRSKAASKAAQSRWKKRCGEPTEGNDPGRPDVASGKPNLDGNDEGTCPHGEESALSADSMRNDAERIKAHMRENAERNAPSPSPIPKELKELLNKKALKSSSISREYRPVDNSHGKQSKGRIRGPGSNDRLPGPGGHDNDKEYQEYLQRLIPLYNSVKAAFPDLQADVFIRKNLPPKPDGNTEARHEAMLYTFTRLLQEKDKGNPPSFSYRWCQTVFDSEVKNLNARITERQTAEYKAEERSRDRKGLSSLRAIMAMLESKSRGKVQSQSECRT